MKKILLFGSKGLFGINFINCYFEKYQILATFWQNPPNKKIKNVNFRQVDIRNKNQVQELIKENNCDIVVHAASLGDVDYCQKHQKEAYQTNVDGTQNIANACAKKQKKLIYLSTNAVYNGQNPPYSEKSRPNPINQYGLTKFLGEKAVKRICQDFMILRLNTMYGWHSKNERHNPATWIIKSLKNKKRIKIVDDVFNNHLYVVSAVNVLDEIINNWQTREIFNIAGRNCLSRFQFAQDIAKVFGYRPSLIEKVDSSYFTKNLTPRPKNTCFDTKKMERNLKNKPWHLSDGLRHMKNHQRLTIN